MSIERGRCELVLAQLGPGVEPPWVIDLQAEATTIGSAVDGPGLLEQPGVEAAHLKVRRDRNDVWILPLNGGTVFLNCNPLTAHGEVSLVKGDRVHLGEPDLGVDLVLTCTADLAAAFSPQVDELDSGYDPPLVNAIATGDRKAGLLGYSPMLDLTPAEYQVVAWMGRGVFDLEEIGKRLFRSGHTVRTQLNRIYEKLGVHSKAELLSLIIQNRLSYENQSRPWQQVTAACNCLVERKRWPCGEGEGH